MHYVQPIKINWYSDNEDIYVLLKVQDSPYGTVYATQLTSIAAKDNVSATVEVRRIQLT